MVLNQIIVNIDWQLLTIILPFVMVIVVIVLGELMFRNRKKRASMMTIPVESHETHIHSIMNEQPIIQERTRAIIQEEVGASKIMDRTKAPADSDKALLEKFNAELEQASKLYSTGQLTKEDFYATVHRITIELNEIKARSIQEDKARTIQEEPLKIRHCIHCQAEIPVEAIYCDRCGRYVGASHK